MESKDTPRLVVITGGPGAGKTALVALAKQLLCHHAVIVPEVATLIFSGGFWRKNSKAGRMGAQRAIFHVQRELEAIVREEGEASVALCDRGTVDSSAYWPDSLESFWASVHTSREQEFERYASVIHLHSPGLGMGYNHLNPQRIESAEEALRIDDRVSSAWDGHPNRTMIPAGMDFKEKMRQALLVLYNVFPECCRDAFRADSVTRLLNDENPEFNSRQRHPNISTNR